MEEKTIQNLQVEKFTEWVFYDGECLMCTQWARRMQPILNPQGIGLAPLQTDWVKKIIAQRADPLKEMLVRTPQGEIVGGADAFIYLSRKIWWWGGGFYLMAQIPGMKFFLRKLYAKIAKKRYCLGGSCRITSGRDHTSSCIINK